MWRIVLYRMCLYKLEKVCTVYIIREQAQEDKAMLSFPSIIDLERHIVKSFLHLFTKKLLSYKDKG